MEDIVQCSKKIVKKYNNLKYKPKSINQRIQEEDVLHKKQKNFVFGHIKT